jgi:hypothetical protein
VRRLRACGTPLEMVPAFPSELITLIEPLWDNRWLDDAWTSVTFYKSGLRRLDMQCRRFNFQ